MKRTVPITLSTLVLAALSFFVGYRLGVVSGKQKPPEVVYLPIDESDKLSKLELTDMDADYRWRYSEIYVPDSFSVEQKFRVLVGVLSYRSFSGLPIEVKSIEQRDGMTVATLNLRERCKGCYGWKGGYFEGSTGGYCTQNTILRTLLQETYTGNWIDVLEFVYEDEPWDNWSIDHINLGHSYRRSPGTREWKEG